MLKTDALMPELLDMDGEDVEVKTMLSQLQADVTQSEQFATTFPPMEADVCSSLLPCIV